MSKEKGKKARTWCFTLFFDSTTKKDASVFELKGNLRYIIWQMEKCPDTERAHFQGYCELKVPLGMASVKALLGYTTIHLESRRGTRDEAREYCLKAETKVGGPWELGSWEAGGSGARNDLDDAARMIRKEGIDAVHDASPGQFVRLQKHFRDYETYWGARTMANARQVLCYWVHGVSNVGKTHAMMDSLGDLFKMDPTNSATWWDCYRSEQALLIDDLMPKTIPACDMVHIADKWKYRMPVKGSFTWARWHLVVVTSNHTPYFVYQGEPNVQSIIRRFTIIEVFTRKDCAAAAERIQREMTIDTKRRILDNLTVRAVDPADGNENRGERGGLGNTALDQEEDLVPTDCPTPIRSPANFC